MSQAVSQRLRHFYLTADPETPRAVESAAWPLSGFGEGGEAPKLRPGQQTQGRALSE
jgi:hypothetical protein